MPRKSRYTPPIERLPLPKPLSVHALWKFINGFHKPSGHQVDKALRRLGFPLRSSLPPRSGNELGVSDLYHLEDMVGVASGVRVIRDYRAYAGSVTQLRLPMLYVYILHEFWRLGEVADAIGLLAKAVLFAPGRYNIYHEPPGTWLLLLYGEFYRDCPALDNAFATIFRTLGTVFKDCGEPDAYLYTPDGQMPEIHLLVRCPLADAQQRLATLAPYYAVRLQEYAGYELNYHDIHRTIRIALYDEFGAVDDNPPSQSEAAEQVRTHWRAVKLHALLSTLS